MRPFPSLRRGRDVRPLRETVAEGDVLARQFVDRDEKIVRPQAYLLHDEPVQRGKQREALHLRATGDEGQFEEDEAIAVRAADETRRVDELSLRKKVREAEVVLRRNREHFLQGGLYGRPDVPSAAEEGALVLGESASWAHAAQCPIAYISR